MELIFPLLILVAFWFLIVRPARRRQADLRATQNAAGVGTRVMLSSGFFAEVTEEREATFLVALAPGTVVEVAKEAVVRIVEPAEPVTGSEDGSLGLGEAYDPRADDATER